MKRIAIGQKIGLILLGVFLCVVILETGLRLSGLVIQTLQERKNKITFREKDVYRIMCLGGSTTAGDLGENSYPEQLQIILNEANIRIKFKVINKGVNGINSANILAMSEKNLEKYNPDMVITMMGENDGGDNLSYRDASNINIKIELFFLDFRVYKLVKLLYLHIISKIENSNFFKLNDKVANLNKNEDYNGDMKQEEVNMSEKGNEKNIDKYIESGSAYFLQLRYKEAEEFYKEALAINPDNYNLYIELAQVYRDQNKKEAAVEASQKAIEIDPNNSFAYTLLGNIYIYFGELDKAKVVLEKAIEIDPGTTWAYQEIGYCYQNQNKEWSKESYKLSKKIINSNIKHELLYGFVATDYLRRGEYKKAEEYYNKANEFRLTHYNPFTKDNYLKLIDIITQRGIKLVCVQHPIRSVKALKKVLYSREEVIFVDNERIFKDALKQGKYEDLFKDNFAGDFGHCTVEGNRLLAKNIAKVILKKVFTSELK